MEQFICCIFVCDLIQSWTGLCTCIWRLAAASSRNTPAHRAFEIYIFFSPVCVCFNLVKVVLSKTEVRLHVWNQTSFLESLRRDNRHFFFFLKSCSSIFILQLYSTKYQKYLLRCSFFLPSKNPLWT